MPSTLESLLRRKRKEAVPRRRPADEEHQSQAALITWAQLARVPEADDVEPGARVADYLFAVPNGGFRTPVTAIKLKAEGVKPGVWDLMLPLPRRGMHGLWVEMKAAAGRLSPEQVEWGNKMQLAGYDLVVCRSVDDAMAAIKSYLDL